MRSFGTNNLPDCSNMCHESSGTALVESIGIGKGSVTVDDIEHADLIVIAGQNPGTNHPPDVVEKGESQRREDHRRQPIAGGGADPAKDPQTVRGVLGTGVPIADEFVQVRLGGEMMRRCSAVWPDCCWRPTTAIPDLCWIATSSPRTATGSSMTSPPRRARPSTPLPRPPGSTWRSPHRVARLVAESERTIVPGDGPDPAHPRRRHHR